MLDGFYPAPGLAFIKHISTDERYTGGSIVIPVQAREKVARQQFEIVALGDYERCDDIEECDRPHTKRGEHKHHLKCKDWVVVRNRAWDRTPDPDVFVVRQSEIIGKFIESSSRPPPPAPAE